VDPLALAPLVVLAVALVGYCLYDLASSAEACYLPRWAWALVCCLSIPFGPILYLTIGRAIR
jgi:hypothetical protein